ncbi:MAG: PKD domain-containing protein [Flavobacteriales bacterium]
MKSLAILFAFLVSALFTQACPTAIVSVEQSCNNYLFYLQETPQGNVIWDFGDGNTTTGGIEIFHEFATDGVYVISATFSGPECPETLMLSASVEVNCGAVNECPTEMWSGPGTECGVMNFEIGSFVDGEVVIWYPGDETGAVTGGHFFSHAYANPGTYTVCAIYSTPLCPDGVELCTQITVEDCNPSLCPTAIVAESIDCDSYVFHVTDIDNAEVVWNFGDGDTLVGGVNADHSWAANGVYIVTAEVNAPDCPIMPPISVITLVYTIEVNCVSEPICPTEIWAFETAECNIMEFELNTFSEGTVIWYPGDESGPVEGGQYFTHTYEFPGIYTVCAYYTGPSCPDGIELCTNVVITECNTQCNDVILGIDSYVQDGGTTALIYNIFNAASGMIAANGEALYTLDDPFFDAALCLPDGCYYLSIDNNQPIMPGQNLDIFLTMNGMNLLETAEIIYQDDISITYFFGVNSDCVGQPECFASFETVYTNTPGHVEFINSSSFSGVGEFSWDYGNGTVGDTFGGNVQYETNGVYTVCLTVTSGTCQNTYCDYVVIENMEVPCQFNEFDVIVEANYFEPMTELLEFAVSVPLGPVVQLYVETNGMMNDTLSLCIPDGCYEVSINSAIPVQALSIICSFEGENIQQLGDLQLLIGETSSVAAIGVNMDCSIGVEEEQIQTVNAYPNPASDNIQFSSNKSITCIEVFDLTGKCILSTKPNQLQTQLNTADWSSGLYVAHITCDGRKERKRFEVVKG